MTDLHGARPRPLTSYGFQEKRETMSEPEQITAARRQWVEDVKALSPAARDGLVQSIIDSAYALDLVVVPKERVQRLAFTLEDDPNINLVVAAKEINARQMLMAAQAIAQKAIDAGAVTRDRVRRLGAMTTRFELLAITPVASGEKPAEPLLSSTAPATLIHR